MLRSILILLALFIAASSLAEEPARDTLWMTKTLRAAPGELKALITDLKALKADGFYEDADRTAPLIMRHSQGDQWDLMLLEPIGSYAAFFNEDRLKAQSEAKAKHGALQRQLHARLAYRDELFAYGPSADFVNAHNEGASFFHIEMFDAAPSMKRKLVKQREMENVYLELTKRRGNLIFVSQMGTNVDAFTIGAYENLQSFAARPDLAEGQSLAAAKTAGFEDDNSIGFYLRTLISAHHDTLANLVE